MNPNKTFLQRVHYYKHIVKPTLARYGKQAQRHTESKKQDYNYFADAREVQLMIFARAMGISKRFLERYV